MLTPGLDKGFVGALNNALAADIDPRPRGHLSIHRQTAFIEFIEVIPIRPMGHQIGIGDQHTGGVRVGLKDANGFARLHQQCLIVFQCLQRCDDLIEIIPGPRRPANAAIDNQLMRVLGHVGMQVVHQHAHRRFRQPGLGGNVGPGRGKNIPGVFAWIAHFGAPNVGASSARLFRIAAR